MYATHACLGCEANQLFIPCIGFNCLPVVRFFLNPPPPKKKKGFVSSLFGPPDQQLLCAF
jgi:hypothetical protein